MEKLKDPKILDSAADIAANLFRTMRRAQLVLSTKNASINVSTSETSTITLPGNKGLIMGAKDSSDLMELHETIEIPEIGRAHV